MHTRTRRSCFASVVVAFLFTIGAQPAFAAAIFSFTQVGGNIVGSLAGSLNVTGATFLGTTPSYDARLSPESGYLNATPGQFGNGVTADIYSATGPDHFGTAFEVGASSATGGAFEVIDGEIILPGNYAGGALNDVLTFSNTSFAALGITPGDFVFTLAGSDDTLTVRFVQPAVTGVPEPESLALLGIGLLGLMAARRRRKT